VVSIVDGNNPKYQIKSENMRIYAGVLRNKAEFDIIISEYNQETENH